MDPDSQRYRVAHYFTIFEFRTGKELHLSSRTDCRADWTKSKDVSDRGHGESFNERLWKLRRRFRRMIRMGFRGVNPDDSEDAYLGGKRGDCRSWSSSDDLANGDSILFALVKVSRGMMKCLEKGAEAWNIDRDANNFRFLSFSLQTI
jgi:hypothetical protein